MKKIIVAVISLAIIIVSTIFITKLLNPDDQAKEVNNNTTISYGDYELFNFDSNVNVYSFKDPSNFHIIVQNINLDYEDGNILVGEESFDEVLEVHGYFAIYDSSVVVMAYKDINKYDHIIMYDVFTKELNIIDKIDSFYVTMDDIIFENIGIVINTSKILDNKIIGTNNDICSIKDKNMIVKQTYEVYYDINTKKFSKNEVLYFTNLYSYINEKKCCKE